MNILTTVPNLLAQANGNVDDNTGLGFIAWIVVGLLAGFIGSRIVNKRGEGVFLDIILGLIGSVVGGVLFHLVGIHRDGSFILSLIVAIVGAVIVLVVYHKLIRGDRARTAP